MGRTIWARVARLFRAADPFFVVKMRINELVITEVANGVYPDAPDATDAQNAAAMAMIHSSVHGKINDLARSVVEEIEKQKKEVAEAASAGG